MAQATADFKPTEMVISCLAGEPWFFNNIQHLDGLV